MAPGAYDIAVTATDPAGNATHRTTRVTVADPVTAGEIAAVLALAAAVLAVALLLWQRRTGLAAWLVRLMTAARERQRRRDLARHEQRMADNARRYADWAARRRELEDLLTSAETLLPQPASDLPALGLRRDEAVYGRFTGSMVELRHRGGQPYPAVVGSGDVVVTDQRIRFEGTKRREWRYDRITSYAHDGHSRTFIGVSDRKTVSGIEHPAPGELTRFLLDLARADHAGTRAAVVTDARHALDEHDALKPQPPAPPHPARQGSPAGV